jgi:hypothetical protein
MSDEYSEFRDEKPPQNIMDEVRAGVALLVQYDAEVVQKELELSEAKAKRNKLKFGDLPLLTKKLGGLMKFDLELEDGTVVGVKRETKTSAKLSEGDPKEVFKWMVANGHAHHISNDLVIPFTKGQEADMAAVESYLKAYEKPVNVSRESNIHPSTYTAFCDRLKKSGAAIDDKVFGIHIVDRVEVDIKRKTGI